MAASQQPSSLVTSGVRWNLDRDLPKYTPRFKVARDFAQNSRHCPAQGQQGVQAYALGLISHWAADPQSYDKLPALLDPAAMPQAGELGKKQGVSVKKTIRGISFCCCASAITPTASNATATRIDGTAAFFITHPVPSVIYHAERSGLSNEVLGQTEINASA